MIKIEVIDLLNYIEEQSQYTRLLVERFIDEQEYHKKLAAIQNGFNCLGLPVEHLKIFRNRKNFVIWLGDNLKRYVGYELALYIGHRKMGLPIPEGLTEKCPKEILEILDRTSNYRFLYEFGKELLTFSLSPEIFLNIHKALLGARTECLLPSLLADLEGISFKTFHEVIRKIPSPYIIYLSPASFLKLLKKISEIFTNEKARLTEELKNMELYSLRLKEQLTNLYRETDSELKDIIEKQVKSGVQVETIAHKISNLFSRLERLFLGNIYHLRDYEKRQEEIKNFFAEEEELKYLPQKKISDKRKKASELYDEYLFFAKFGPLTASEDKNFSKALTAEFEMLHRRKSKDLPLLQKFEKRSLLGVELNFNEIKEAYDSFMKKIIVPQCLGQYLLDIVNCLPPQNNGQRKVMVDLANLRILKLVGETVLEFKENRRSYPANLINFVEQFRKCITVLVYDIRGSSYMGIKLHNALKEQRIKYKFAKEMADVVKKYAGFLLKDTGDGGIAWFAENSESLYNHLYAHSVTGGGMNLRYSIFSGAEFQLIPAFDSAKRAVLCARDMVLKAEEFIRANYIHYREWFMDVTERTLEVDGITYALLPPQFKSLFRIGIGISSGLAERDVVIAANSFGDPDLVGPILSDAHLYSMERQPGRSVIICDLPTFINLMLNIENFEFPVAEQKFEKYLQLVSEIRRSPHPYTISEYKLSIVPRGINILEELNKQKALVEAETTAVLLDDDNNMYNEQGQKIKLIYEILLNQ